MSEVGGNRASNDSGTPPGSSTRRSPDSDTVVVDDCDLLPGGVPVDATRVTSAEGLNAIAALGPTAPR